MRFHKQLFKHEAAEGVYGDCHRTALACVLNLGKPEDAPHFIATHERLKAQGEEFDWQGAQERWLNDLGYTTVDVIYDGSMPVDQLFEFMRARNPYAIYLLGGRSPRGFNHTVVCRGDHFYHDPHPDGGFVVGPLDHGFWEITFILPLIMKETAP